MEAPSPSPPPDEVIQLNFTPRWARTPPPEQPSAAPETPARPGRGERPPRGGRPGGGVPRRGDARTGRPPEPRARRPDRERAAPPREAPWRPPEDLAVAFLPERRGLGPLAGMLARSRRAYSLFEVASLFLSRPEYYAVKVETLPVGDKPRRRLYQCTECRAVFLDRATASAHGLDRHFERFCRREEQEVEPPRGQFICVARCTLSGTLLGPPNYHAFNDRVAEVQRRLFPHLTPEEYRRRIEMVHDPALIEQWKDGMKRQTTYRFGEGESAVCFTRFQDAEAHFREHHLPQLVCETDHAVMPGSVSADLNDPVLGRALREAREREQRFPLRLSITLRLAFRHFGLHTFKAGGGAFITSVPPSAMDPGQAIPAVREILEQTAARPGGTIPELMQALRPGVAPDSRDGAEIASHLRWLIEKGHVIEFSDGRLAVPSRSVSHVQHAHPPAPRRRRRRRASGRARPGAGPAAESGAESS